MTDEQLEAAIEAIQAMLEQKNRLKVIEGTAEAVALPAPDFVLRRTEQGHGCGGQSGRAEGAQSRGSAGGRG